MTTPALVFEPQSRRTTFAVSGVTPLPDRIVEFPLGYANTTATYLLSDPPRPEELSAALSVIELHLDDVLRDLNAERSPDDGRSAFDMVVRDATVAGAGPIFSTLAAVETGEGDRNFDGFELTREAAEDVFRTIATESLDDRLYNPGLGIAWAPLIVGGSCLVVETFRSWDLESIIVSQSTESVDSLGATG